MEGSDSTNMALWDKVKTTDPSFTKNFSGPEGKVFTATNGTYQARKATEVFGPCGIGWGFEVLDEKYVSGHAIGFDANGNSLGTTVVHVVRLKLWYVYGQSKGEITQFGQTTFVGLTESRELFHDEDAPKKSVTDAISKCLSLLGFSADVYLGLYDDNKYVEGLRNQFGSGPQVPQSKAANPLPRPSAAVSSQARPGAAQAANNSRSSSKAQSGQQDINAWIRRIGVLGAEALANARDTAKEYFAGDDLKRINDEITKRQQALASARPAVA